MRLAGAADRARLGDAREAALLRLALPAAKFWVCKRFPAHAAEALECLGGNGYVEDSGMPRLYREAPLNSVWEGAGNVTALDVVRALTRQPSSAEALWAEVADVSGANRTLDAAVTGVRQLVTGLADMTGVEAEHDARRLAAGIAVVLQGALLVRHAPGEVAEVFCETRLGGGGVAGPAVAFGMLRGRPDVAAILDRAQPARPGG
jgi:putative acyl-CoA dehydrogenase